MLQALAKHAEALTGMRLCTGEGADEVARRVREHLDAMDAVRATEIAAKVAVQRERKLETALKLLLPNVRLYLDSRFGRSAPVLEEFGLKPFRPGKPSMKTLARAVEKRRETRKLRGTMGKKQRRAIKAKS